MQAPPLSVDGRTGHHFYIKYKKNKKLFLFLFGHPWPMVTNLHPNLFCGRLPSQSAFGMFQDQESLDNDPSFRPSL
jgi:hypothetical protein